MRQKKQKMGADSHRGTGRGTKRGRLGWPARALALALACLVAFASAVGAPSMQIEGERVPAQIRAPRPGDGWKARLGSDPIYSATLDRYIKSQLDLRLPDPAKYPARDNWQPLADTGCAFVNLYRLSADRRYLEQARRIADFLLASNDYLVAHKASGIPYLGWGPEKRQGYFKCPTVDNYQADDAWDTAAVLRLLLKYSEAEQGAASAKYVTRARKIIDQWAYKDFSLNDGPFARAGMRWFMKSNAPCEIRYVKNTNLVMGEQLLRLYLLTSDAGYQRSASRVLNAEMWDILTRHNLAYSSAMIYEDRSDPAYAQMAAQNDSKVAHSDKGQRDDTISCGDKDSSCWNHLGFEAYDLSMIRMLLDKSRSTATAPGNGDVETAIDAIMRKYRGSRFGDPNSFPWDTNESNTHVTAYNCAQRFSSASAARDCTEALKHKNASGTVFYSLVPDAIF